MKKLITVKRETEDSPAHWVSIFFFFFLALIVLAFAFSCTGDFTVTMFWTMSWISIECPCEYSRVLLRL